jgi:hypothetical protein
MRRAGGLDSNFGGARALGVQCYYSRKGAVAAKFDAALRFAQFSRAARSGAVTTIVLAPVDYESL